METAPEQATPPTEPRRRRRWPRIVLAAVAVLALVLLLELVALARMRGDLDRGRAELTAARRALVAGEVADAAAAFDAAGAALGDAAAHADDALGRVAGAVPWLGNTADAAQALATSGALVADAGAGITGAVAQFPDGVGSLAPSDGRIPVDRYAELGGAAREAAERAAEAETILAGAPDTFVPGAVSEAVWDAQEQVGDLSRQLEGATLLLDGAAGFAGATEPRRYLIVSQNPGELRGTGGIWGAYTIVTLDDGGVRIEPTHPTQQLQDFSPDEVPAPSEDYARNYDQFGGAGSWQNMNATPDFPAAARAALANYASGEGEQLDGVIAVDPFALQELLAVTGPVTLPNGLRVDADNVVDLTTNRVYDLLPQARERTEIVGQVAAIALTRFLAMNDRGLPRVRHLAEAIANGHMRIYATEPSIQQGLATLGVDGALTAPTGDVFGVTVNNGSGSKIDVYAARTVTYDVQLGGDGEVIGTATVEIDNRAPTRGQPRYVIGPYLGGSKAGDQIPLTTIWCHAPCELADARRDGEPVEVATGTENGIHWLRDYRTIPSGETGTLSATWHATEAWVGSSGRGRYDLTLIGQTTVGPSTMHVTIRAPEGTRIVWTSEPMGVEGNTATWEGSPDATTRLAIRFRAPLPARLFRIVN